jgi:chromosome segregation ATPase
MADITETIVTTLTSGVLTAVGAYSAIVWKLTKRVTILEERIEALDKKTDELKQSEEELEEKHNNLRVDVNTQLSQLKEEMTEQLSSTSHKILTRLDTIQTKLSEDLGDFRTTCADRTSRYIGRASFEQYVKEEERRWQEFYRAVGKLEAVIDRAFRGSSPPPPRLTRTKDGPKDE